MELLKCSGLPVGKRGHAKLEEKISRYQNVLKVSVRCSAVCRKQHVTVVLFNCDYSEFYKKVYVCLPGSMSFWCCLNNRIKG